jgi:hypothetical protein
VTVRRKWNDVSLGASRALGTAGIRIKDSRTTYAATTSLTTSPNLTVAVNDVILAVATVPISARELTPSSTGLTFTAIYSSSHLGPHAWYAPIPAGQEGDARTVSVTNTNSTTMSLHVFVLSGVDLAVPIDVSASLDTYAAATTINLTGVTTNTPRAVACIAVNTSDDNSLTVTDNGWTTPYGPWNVATNAACAIAFNEMAVPGATGTATLTETVNGPDASPGAIRFALRALQG